ncbi:Pyrimidodiazepine synthase [Armadillidium vulgare]|nr:Pyrimidodiazepine synthase [Armadillidium vulgare]
MFKTVIKVAKNTKHFAAGSECPPLQKDLLRIYSMYYCPYAQRTRIVLNAKNVKHETVNVHLVEKPDWFFKINPLAKVPTLQLNDKIMFESMVTCDYLDETYPDPPLYPKDPWAKGWDKCLIEVFEAKVTRGFIKFFLSTLDKEAVREITEAINNGLEIFEKELVKRGTKFFLGDRPGMLDYAIFPWFERLPLVKYFYPDFHPLPKDRFPKMTAYIENMMQDEPAGSTVAVFDDHVAFLKSKFDGKINYDIGV